MPFSPSQSAQNPLFGSSVAISLNYLHCYRLSLTMAANAMASAAAFVKEKTTLPKIIRQQNNENAAKLFAAGTVGMIVLFMIFHWIRFAFKRYVSKKNQSVRFSRVPA